MDTKMHRNTQTCTEKCRNVQKWAENKVQKCAETRRKVQTCTENCLHLSALFCALLLSVLFCPCLYLSALTVVSTSTGSHYSKPLLRTQVNHKNQFTSYNSMRSMQVECTAGKPPSLIKEGLSFSADSAEMNRKAQICTDRCRNIKKRAEIYRNVQKMYRNMQTCTEKCRNVQKFAEKYRKPPA